MFTEEFDRYSWEEVRSGVYSKTTSDVALALTPGRKKSADDFMALISPAAAPFLERMAEMSFAATSKKFGKTVQLYAPLYLSNECRNICTYCGFSLNNKIKRKTLSDQEIIREAEMLRSMGFEHILLVTGEARNMVGMEYFKNALNVLRPYFSLISMEVQPLEESHYKELSALGLHSVMIYQETYHKENYGLYHPKGRKSDFTYRLETPDRLGKSGIHKIGLGVLLGLEDWRTDAFFCALHMSYLEKKYWQTRYSVSFPRLRPYISSSTGEVTNPNVNMSDRELVQLICAFRIFNEEAELSISTRESEKFRDNIFRFGITTMSAGSKTNPGGYDVEPDSLEQFEISDDRSPAEIEEMIRKNNFVPVWKDWEKIY